MKVKNADVVWTPSYEGTDYPNAGRVRVEEHGSG